MAAQPSCLKIKRWWYPLLLRRLLANNYTTLHGYANRYFSSHFDPCHHEHLLRAMPPCQLRLRLLWNGVGWSSRNQPLWNRELIRITKFWGIINNIICEKWFIHSCYLERRRYVLYNRWWGDTIYEYRHRCMRNELLHICSRLQKSGL